MDITLYFLKLEDKYWGLFLLSAFLLLVLSLRREKEEEKQGRSGGKVFLPAALGIYGFLAYLVFVNPATAYFYSSLPRSGEYYEILSHIWLFPVFLPLAVMLAREAGKGKHPFLCALLVGMLFLTAGDLFFLEPFGSPSEAGMMAPTEEASYRLVWEDAKERGVEPVIWGPASWMAHARLYENGIRPLYEKDIAKSPENYSECQRVMRDAYDRYESPDSPLDNKEDQMGALANFLHVYSDAGCNYVAVQDPESLGLSLDADEIFLPLGYEKAGKSGELLIYYFRG
ncbi:MAG: hypothetical protein K5739_07695 [Lachnospiraceae bacterium]|nr:hypothetical protein [Lachnospiraceae bacterium]